MDSDEELERLDLERILDWDDVLDDASYYEILGLEQNAEHDAVRRAFHAFALGFHPDSFRAADEETQKQVQRVFERGVEAYRVLAERSLRAEYDLALAKGELRLGRGEKRPGVGTGAKSLDELCLSPGAKLYAKRAEELIGQGNLRQAQFELWRALRAEESANPELVERIQALESLIRHGG